MKATESSQRDSLKATAHADDLLIEARVELAVASTRAVVEEQRVTDLGVNSYSGNPVPASDMRIWGAYY